MEMLILTYFAYTVEGRATLCGTYEKSRDNSVFSWDFHYVAVKKKINVTNVNKLFPKSVMLQCICASI